MSSTNFQKRFAERIGACGSCHGLRSRLTGRCGGGDGPFLSNELNQVHFPCPNEPAKELLRGLPPILFLRTP